MRRDAFVGITAADLMKKKLREPRFVVDGLLSQGLNLLCSRPKTGKSWWSLAASIAVSNGSQFLGLPVAKGEVLYAALEDTLPRLRSRLSTLCKLDAPSADLHFHTTWPKLDDGGLDQLDAWLGEHRRAKLVIFDTLGKVSTTKATYSDQYDALGKLKSLADRRRIALLLIHHLTKAGHGDWTQEIQGSVAVSGAADCLLHLARPRNGGDAVLNVTGRDVQERELALWFDADNGSWTLVGDAKELWMSP